MRKFPQKESQIGNSWKARLSKLSSGNFHQFSLITETKTTVFFSFRMTGYKQFHLTLLSFGNWSGLAISQNFVTFPQHIPGKKFVSGIL